MVGNPRRNPSENHEALAKKVLILLTIYTPDFMLTEIFRTFRSVRSMGLALIRNQLL